MRYREAEKNGADLLEIIDRGQENGIWVADVTQEVMEQRLKRFAGAMASWQKKADYERGPRGKFERVVSRVKGRLRA